MEGIAMRLLNKSVCLKNRIKRFTTTTITTSLNRRNINERDNNKFSASEGRNTDSTNQHARSYTATPTSTDWPINQLSSHQHSLLNKYFQQQHSFIRHYCTVKTTRRKMVSAAYTIFLYCCWRCFITIVLSTFNLFSREWSKHFYV